MLMFLPAPLTGAFMFLFFGLNLVAWAVPVYALILIKLFTWGNGRVLLSRWTARTAQQWAACNVWLLDTMLDIHWDMRGIEELSLDGKYLAVSNHQSWNDIPVLMKAFDRRAPFFKFFLKQQLVWVPILGLAWWGLDFPFMRRYTREQVEKNPALKGKDLETTRAACAKFRQQPVLVINYLEGTRFTPAKHERQQSPFKHLLRPKSGGIAFALASLGDVLDCVLDITVAYPDGAVGFWDMLCGRMHRVVVDIRQIQVPDEFFTGDYTNDPEFRERFQAWVTALWERKDRRVAELLAAAG